jgi:hypothetical protein
MTTQFKYYDNWKTQVLECAQCGWRGTFEQGAVDYFGEVMDSSCPGCTKMLAIVSYPTNAETEANMDKLTDQEKREFSDRKRFLVEWEEASLKSADQLPDLEGPAFTLVWDMVGREKGHERLYTVLRHGEQEIWRERACYEGYERFREIVEILKVKFGHRLLDVVPTDASTRYLYGDKLYAHKIIQDIRKSFTKLRLIRANLESSWVFGLQMQAEEKEEAQCYGSFLNRIEAEPLMSEPDRLQFLAEVVDCERSGELAPWSAERLRQRLTRAVRRSMATKKHKRKR